jgi:hypothetical protein
MNLVIPFMNYIFIFSLMGYYPLESISKINCFNRIINNKLIRLYFASRWKFLVMHLTQI